MVSLGLVALGMWIFILACRFFPVFPEGPVGGLGELLDDDELAARELMLLRRVPEGAVSTMAQAGATEEL
jgi:hypothetical protein